jgi:hypothetical protein
MFVAQRLMPGRLRLSPHRLTPRPGRLRLALVGVGLAAIIVAGIRARTATEPITLATRARSIGQAIRAQSATEPATLASRAHSGGQAINGGELLNSIRA